MILDGAHLSITACPSDTGFSLQSLLRKYTCNHVYSALAWSYSITSHKPLFSPPTYHAHAFERRLPLCLSTGLFKYGCKHPPLTERRRNENKYISRLLHNRPNPTVKRSGFRLYIYFSTWSALAWKYSSLATVQRKRTHKLTCVIYHANHTTW